ncbi:hypothetical protein BCR33DRAFT_714543 [Rhizoclosmatium globosum]|uniref:M23ase beta-sheet core domain-containing protein n=1 Tax=Rhizoclosmatium globosum TaxID=329046 RepID=A0A1Y2CMD8_9FUNG|nr:hypothetical protein BCR33DRAFT_714543 [Rhizoclosmatium globosum]|eukprot:ORY48117.1 hypothetical protein BCR33DRAFT_714543 [Rhizoclosmatium globosum]
MIGSVMHNFQTYGEPYLHGGLDIRTAANASCHSPIDGKVVKVVKYGDTDAYWSVMVRDEYDFIWQFHHLHPTVKKGDKIKRGRVVGNVVFWGDLMNGANYHHTHMNVVRASDYWDVEKDGYPLPYVPGWTYYNPLSFLNHGKSYTSTIKPSSLEPLHLFHKQDAPAFAQSTHLDAPHLAPEVKGPIVKGVIHAVAHLSTELTSPNNIPGTPFLQCPHEIVWFISKRPTQPVNLLDTTTKPIPKGHEGATHIASKYELVTPVNTFVSFESLPPVQWPLDVDAKDTGPLKDLIKYEFVNVDGEKVVSQYEYSVRRAYFSVTNLVRGEISSGEGSGWDTRGVKNGEYLVHVLARDWFGEWGHWMYPVVVKNK